MRIKKITDYASDGSFVQKQYKYERAENTSSGNLLSVPLYLLAYETARPYVVPNQHLGPQLVLKNIKVVHSSVVGLSQYFFNQTHIEYSRVTEELSDGSETIYDFTNYAPHPDTDAPEYWVQPYTTTTPAHVDKLISLMLSTSPQRGKLINKIMCKNGQPVYREEYKYTNLRDTSYHLLRAAKSSLYPIFILGDYNMYPESKKITTYFNGKEISDTINYNYNKYGQQVSETKRDKSGRYYTKRTQSLRDKASSAYSTVEKLMAQKYLFSFPLSHEETIQYKDGDSLSPEYFLNKAMCEYKDYQGHGKVYNLAMVRKSAYMAEQQITAPDTSDFWIEQTINIRDNSGNPILITNKAGVKTGYIWGYKGLYPVAQIDNITDISQIKSIQGLSNVDKTPLSTYLTVAQERALLSIPNALTTLYDYQPFVGITKQTDGSGKITYYDYDQYGKLISIRDEKNNLVESYQYNVKQ